MSYQSEGEIESVVRGFETCETGADDFKHKDHLVAAVWYVHNLGREVALERMRAGLIGFLTHYEGDTQKYSEEITRCWIERVDQRLSELGSEMSLVDKCNLIVESTEFLYVK